MVTVGRALSEDSILEECGIDNGDIIYLVLCLRGGDRGEFKSKGWCLMIKIADKEIKIRNPSPSDTIESLHQKIYEMNPKLKNI